jgi:hypothetical protein
MGIFEGIFGWLMVIGVAAIWASRPRPARRTTRVTVQHHTTAFHVVLTVLSGGLWLPVWALSRHTRVITTRRIR